MSFTSILAQSYQSDSMMYDNGSSSMSPSNSDATMVVFITMLGFFVVFAIIAYVVSAFLLARIFKKAGVEQWIAWVPFYNTWKTFQLGNQPGWWSILLFIPIVNIVAGIIMYIAQYNIGLKLQKEGWFVLLAIFIPIVWFIWLAFDESKWDDDKTGLAAVPGSTPNETPSSTPPTPPAPAA